MSFRFPLDAVLRLRESIEKREEIALQRIQQEIAQVQNKIDEATAKIAGFHGALTVQLQKPSPAGKIQMIRAEIEAFVEERKSLTATLDGLQQRQKKQLHSYRAAHRDRQMLTDMRAEQRTEYEQKQERKLQKFLDDIFVAQSHGS